MSTVKPFIETKAFKKWPEIGLHQTPDHDKWTLGTIYKPHGARMNLWNIRFDGIQLISTYGLIDGKLQESPVEVVINSSNRTLQEQALQVARYRYNKQIRKGYLPPNVDTERLVLPMLAYDFSEKSIKGFNVLAVQPKLDGIRSIMYMKGDNILKMSRGNKDFSHISHFDQELRNLWKYLPPGTGIDGEMYVHDIKFEEIQSIVTTRKKIHPDIEKLEFWIFDINYELGSGQPQPFEVRYETLVQAINCYIRELNPDGQIKKIPRWLKIVKTVYCRKIEEMTDLHNKFVKKGFEGIMIKKTGIDIDPDDDKYKQTLYKAGKSNHILKWKYKKDEEGQIIDIKEGIGKFKGKAVMIIRDPRGNIVDVSMAVSQEQKAKYFAQKDKYIGKLLTYQYQDLTKKGVPRFIVGKSIRKSAYEG